MDADPAIEQLSFEQALRELETIVGRLESGDTPLAEAGLLAGIECRLLNDGVVTAGKITAGEQ